MNMCTLCGSKTDETTHLSLYVCGSEGVEICLPCRMLLTDIARSIKNTASSSYLRGIKEYSILKKGEKA